MLKHTFLIEIGTEELPPKSLRYLAENFYLEIMKEFKLSNVCYETIKWFASPRRFAIKIDNLNKIINKEYIEKKGPSLVSSFDVFGNPTKVAKKWANNIGIKVEEASLFENKKGKWLVYRYTSQIKSIKNLIYNIVIRSLNKLNIPKKMRWGNNNNSFIRPVRTVTMLLDNNLIKGKVLGVKSNRIMFGHRFMNKKKIIIKHASHYPEILTKNKVIADYFDRKRIIYTKIKENARKLGGIVDLNDSLLDEINSLVEWPIVLTASFKKEFLTLPIEILLYIIKHDLKHFPVYHKYKNNQLIPFTIFVINIESNNPKQVILGHEKVMHSKLEDAIFFFKRDIQYSLKEFLPLLDKISFQKYLGTLRDKTYRVKHLSMWIADSIGADKKYTSRAGLLSKCDLVSEVVCRFTCMQGIMGMYYARYCGEPEIVALAQKEQYQPKYYGDDLPSTLVSCSLSIADKIDNIVGIIGINKNPNSSEDPFALRRNAIGIISILIGKSLSIDLKELVIKSICLYEGKLINKNVLNEVMDFIYVRIFSWYKKKKYNLEIIQSVLILRPTNMLDLNIRLKELNNISKLESFRNLITIFKRISNILIKYNYTNSTELKISMLDHPSEIRLAKIVFNVSKNIQMMIDLYCYKDALFELLCLSEPVNIFFKDVLIITNNTETKNNRLSLLLEIRKLFLKIADLSVIQ